MKLPCCIVAILTLALPAATTVRADTAHDLNEAGFWLEAQSLRLCRQSRVTMNDGTSGLEPAASGYHPAIAHTTTDTSSFVVEVAWRKRK